MDLNNAPPELIAALVSKTEAETEAARAEARADNARASGLELEATAAEIALEREQYKRERELVNDHHTKFFRFDTQVDPKSVEYCIDTVAEWCRLAKPDEDVHVKIQFNSPGGSVWDGLALFDEIQHWRRQGVRFTTSTIGMAASMAGILLQAGDKRVMAPESWLLIHKTSFGVLGDFDEVQDRVKLLDRIQGRILDIFAARAKEAGENGTASEPITRELLDEKWERRDWWIPSDEALKFGLVDEVR